MHILTSSCLLESEEDRHTLIHTPTLDLACTNIHIRAHLLHTQVYETHTHAWSRVHQHTYQGFHYIHTQVAVYWKFGWLWQTRMHTPMPTLNCLHKYTYTAWCIPLSHLQERFPYVHATLHATCVIISPVWYESF